MRYNVGGFRGQILPVVGAYITIPDPLINTARGIAVHNKISRMAMTVVLQHHHFKRMPGHFRQTNRSKYAHMDRKKSTKRRKRKTYRSITDLVKSGKTRDKFLGTHPTVRFSGNAAETLRGFLRYRWPFPVSGEDNPNRVTVKQMEKELATWTFQELSEAVELYRDTYVSLWEKEIAKRPKWKKKIKPRLASI